MSIEVRALELSGKNVLPVQPTVPRPQPYSSFRWSDATVPQVSKIARKRLEGGASFRTPLNNNKVELDE